MVEGWVCGVRKHGFAEEGEWGCGCCLNVELGSSYVRREHDVSTRLMELIDGVPGRCMSRTFSS